MYKGKLAVCIMGIQGCGKGTQSKKIKELFDLVHISTGDLFRAHIAEQTELGKELKGYLDEGALVPDELVIRLLKDEIDNQGKGFILDGFPRNTSQAEFLLQEFDIDKVIYMDLAEDLAIARMSARQNCPACKIEYNLINKPKVADKCDKCGGDLHRRADDNPTAIAKRVSTFNEQTAPLLDFFASKNLLIKINADQTPEQVFEKIKESLQ